MSNTPIRLVSLKKDGQDQTVYYDAKAQSYYLRRMPKKSGNDLALFITFLISAIIGTILWIGKFFFPLPTITLSNPLLWWIGLFVTTILPFYFWWAAYRQVKKVQIQPNDFVSYRPEVSERRHIKRKWAIERAWIIFVLLLLPPTSLLFLILYIFKMNLIDAVLLTLHATLFLRRLQPDVWLRLKLPARKIK
ncbi:hypothetical protein H7198_05745 [Fructobacillus sp. CRL 2054]|uniref:hypothetical protein n=1 Tax=Fructobacillus sp. CRL 2054 TaxID=2763007 RepID=UPI002379F884|nr:hypothetical protein [Fructobacillus sp. CRL 2054]MDD9139103.1 hypothetical protein [Fructobacillus sp. CRL 2054]